MKNQVLYLFGASLFCSIIFSSCDQNMFTGCPGDDAFDSNNYFSFSILDNKTKGNIWSQMPYPGYRDTIKIYRDDKTIVYYAPSDFIGQFNLKFINRNEDKNVLNQLISRRFYVYLNYLDTDTIDIDFEMMRDRCHDHVMKIFKVSYNDSVYFNEPTGRVPNINFIKEF